MSYSSAIPRCAPALQFDPRPPRFCAGFVAIPGLLRLSDPEVGLEEGKQRLRATATLIYEPPDYPKSPRIEGGRFQFTAPLGPIEAEDLRWYLERYHIWPVGLFRERAEGIEKKLPQWGGDLFAATLSGKAARTPLEAWRGSKGNAQRFSVQVDHLLPGGSEPERQQNALEAATLLMALPWELLHDGRAYLFQGAEPVAVRRRLTNRQDLGPAKAELPIRILLVSPRPEGDTAGYIDHRVSARALVEALNGLGDLARLTVLDPPSFPALGKSLRAARERGEPFDVVHFDGHGVFDARHGLGALCFEDPQDQDKLERRAVALVHADKLAETIRDHRIPLVFLEACQSAQSDQEPTASVAARLLEEGCSAVVAMGYSVLVETARRFTEAFYGGLASGQRVGEAFLAGQVALHDDRYRLEVMGAGRFELSDWFVPVLYQEVQDPLLFVRLPAAEHKRLQAQRRTLSLGRLPEPPPQTFIGRSRELLALERLLASAPYALVRGSGGAGKTTLAAELARWLVATQRFAQAAFVSLEDYAEPRGVLDTLGRQLVAGWTSVAEQGDLEQARQAVDRALRDRPSILVIDNCESLLTPHALSPTPLPEGEGQQGTAAESPPAPPESTPSPQRGDDGMDAGGRATHGAVAEGRGEGEANPPQEAIFHLLTQLQAADPRTRLVFTSREPLPAPYDHPRRTLSLGPLSEPDAIALVAQVLKNEGLEPRSSDPGRTPEEITELVEAVGRHARALVLLAREVARRGVRSTTAELRTILADLDRRHPGDRERSLYASLELSLRRLPGEIREQVRVLAPFQGGANINVIGLMLGGDIAAAQQLALALIAVGLGEDRGHGHLGLDPALPAYLARELDDPQALEARWARAMAGLLGFLYQQQFEDSQQAFDLTRLELGNLLRLLDWAETRAEPAEVVDWARKLEALVANLGLPGALARAAAVRERAARRLEGQGWGHAAYLHQSSAIDRLLEQGDLSAALGQAQALLRRCLAGGDGAYPEAAYDIAWAHFKVGRVLNTGGRADAALGHIQEARRRFEALGQAGERMASVCLTEQGDCLTDLGRLEEAAASYEESITQSTDAGRERDVAVVKGQLGTVRKNQRRYPEALEAFAEARRSFEALGEPGMVATAWHQTGMVYKRVGDHDRAEHAHRQSLAIEVKRGNRPGEASSLNELGNLYGDMGRLEQAVNCYRQAAEIYVERQDLRHEGVARSNLAGTLLKLGRLPEARDEVRRAIECKRPFGHVAEPWKTWNILQDLEQAAGDPAAAAEARRQAVAAYLAYRRDGGESQSGGGRLCEWLAQAIAQGATDQAARDLSQLAARPDLAAYLQALISKLQAILQGARDPALADDPALDYDDAAELTLLLERLGQA